MVIENAETQNTEQIIALLKTERYDSFSVHSADNPPTQIRKILSEANDSVALFSDVSTFDQSHRLQGTLSEMMKDVKNVGTDESKSRHLIALFSNVAASILEPEDIFRLDVGNLKISQDAKSLQTLIENFDALVIKTMQETTREMLGSIMTEFDILEDNDASEIYTGYRLLLRCLLMIHILVKKLLGIKLFADTASKQLTEWFGKPTDTFDTTEAICHEFSAILNRRIRKGYIFLIKKDRITEFDMEHDDNNYAISFGEHLCIPVQTFEQVIMPRIKSASKASLVQALKEREFLYATKHNYLPLDLFTTDGHYQTVKCYAVSKKLLDSDIQDRVNMLGVEGFFQIEQWRTTCLLIMLIKMCFSTKSR